VPGPNQPALAPGFILPPTPFRPTDVLGAAAGARAQQTSAATPLGDNWFVRAGGSNNNGGSDKSLTALRSGTDGVANNTTTFTSATAAFTSADVGRGICISTGATARRHQIVSVTNGTTVILDRACTLSASGQTWAIGGAWADPRAAWADSAITGDTNSPVGAGDTVWVGAGVYRFSSTMGANWRPVGGLVQIFGDVTGAMTGDVGMVQWTAYTAGDRTAPSLNQLIDLNGKPNLSFANLYCVGGEASSNVNILANTAGSVNVTWRDCAFQQGSSAGRRFFSIGAAYGSNMNWLFDRCLFIGGGVDVISATAGGHIQITATLGAGPDYDFNITMTNCSHLLGPTVAISVISGGSGTGKGGGLRIYNASVLGPALLNVTGSSTTVPCLVKNCFSYGGNQAFLTAAVAGQILEDYNMNTNRVANTLVTAGPHSQNLADASWAPLFYFGQERVWGAESRVFGEPIAGGPLAPYVFGADGSQTPLDGRAGPRPSLSTRIDSGAFQAGNNFGKETGTVHTGANAISVVGDGFQDFDLAVDAGVLTISVYCQFDSNYAGPLPQLQIVKGGQVGVGDVQVSFDSLARNAWEQQSITIDPTQAGIVTVRLIAGDTSGIGKTIFDTFSVA